MEQTRESKLLRNTAILSMGVFFSKLATFITLPLLTGHLSKEDYGMYDLVLNLVFLLLPIATLQIQTAAFRFLLEKRDDIESQKKIVSNIYVYVIPTSAVVLAALYYALYNQKAITRIIICAYFFFEMLLSTTRQICRGIGKNFFYAVSTLISSIIQILCIVVFVCFMNSGLSGAIFALLIGEVLAFVYLAYKIMIWKYIDLKLIDIKQIKQMLSYSWPMIPNSLSMWVMKVSDRFVITAVMGVAANAVYAVAYKIPSILNLVENTFNMAWQESAALAVGDSDSNLFYTNIFSKVYNLAVGSLSGLIGITPVLFYVLVRGDYAEAYNQILVLYIAVFFFVLSSFWGALYVAFQRTRSVARTAVVAAAINFIVDVALIKYIGLYAASGSTLISYIVLCIYRIIDTRKFLKIKYNYRNILITLIIIIAQCFACTKRMVLLDIINFLVGGIVFVSLNKSLLSTYIRKIIK